MTTKGEEQSKRVECRVDMPGDRQETLEQESRVAQRIYRRIQGLVFGFSLKIWGFLQKAWDVAVSEPRKVIHGLKVGLALSLVSLFYYMKPLYDGVGGNAMWAVMTVVVVFEYSVGATLAKSFNRITATLLAGCLGIGVHWVASQCGEKVEPIIVQTSVFLLAAAATFSRFIPSVKARFDYGAMIFILTFCFVSISGYRVEKLLVLARNRVSTIGIGISICLFISMLFYPIWAGKELHNLIHHNLEMLADFLDGGITEYFNYNGTNDSEGNSSEKEKSYKCVLTSKATEESLANFARWEPAHGRFNFRHPWKQYLKIGASMRRCAYCMETLNGCINSENQAPESVKKHFREVCLTLSSCSSNVLKELAMTIKTMKHSTKTELLIEEMNFAVQDLQNALKTLSKQPILPPTAEADKENAKTCTEEMTRIPKIVTLLEIFPVATVASLLIEIEGRVEGIVFEVDQLARQAEFDIVSNKKNNKPSKCNEEHGTMTNLQRV